MHRPMHGLRSRTAFFAATALIIALPYSTEALSGTQVNQINLVTDSQSFLASQGFAPAATEDPALKNPWGMSFSQTSPFWISDQNTGLATLYTANGAKVGLTVTIPGASGAGPTGQVFSGASGFSMKNGAGSPNFIFANLDGSISGWNNGLGTTAAVQLTTPGAVYTGLALGNNAGNNLLYAANHAGGIDVFNSNFDPATVTGSFTDPNVPAGLTPFNITNVGGLLYVTYAIAGPDADEAMLGQGAVSVYNPDGTLVVSFASGGNLLSPWGVTKAPSTWGEFANAILIGNFSDEDGFINAFDSTGKYLGMVQSGSDPFSMPYLWALGTRTGGTGFNGDAVYFTAGIGDEEHGLFAELVPVPEPSTWAMMLFGFGAMGFAIRRQKAPAKALAQVV